MGNRKYTGRGNNSNVQYNKFKTYRKSIILTSIKAGGSLKGFVEQPPVLNIPCSGLVSHTDLK
jgi:hypothetical protein